ncbi:MAG: pyridoxal phosphate-dependent aminotransferase [SAR324 cluster bacterium]|nr:pyridoxal phosphate-dependent aminotransferase [SAR324 cluster bacterium]
MAISRKMEESMSRSSWIRQMFEEGERMKQIHGAANVFDFSLGNPVLEPPPEVHATLIRLLQSNQGLHRYMPNAGLPGTRQFVADELSLQTGLKFDKIDVVLSVGAGGGLNALFKAILDPEDEVVALAPYFVEYGFYVDNHGGKLVVAHTDKTFQPELNNLDAVMTSKTKAVIINSPNNPTGVVYSQETINQLGSFLREKEKQWGHPIFLISDEPYRNIVFDDIQPGNVFLSHPNSVMVTSHSKDLGLAGERIGFVAIHPDMEDRKSLQNALVLTTRILGFVNAPALMQHLLPELKGVRISSAIYQDLRDLFYDALTGMGFKIIKPQGAFYMFPESPVKDEIEFIRQALTENLLLVPGRGFGSPGYFRIAYCFERDKIERSLERFERLAQFYGL